MQTLYPDTSQAPWKYQDKPTRRFCYETVLEQKQLDPGRRRRFVRRRHLPGFRIFRVRPDILGVSNRTREWNVGGARHSHSHRGCCVTDSVEPHNAFERSGVRRGSWRGSVDDRAERRLRHRLPARRARVAPLPPEAPRL